MPGCPDSSCHETVMELKRCVDAIKKELSKFLSNSTAKWGIGILAVFLLASPAFGATYSAYFSNAATGNATGTDTPGALSDCDGSDAANTCSTLAHAQTYLDLASSGDTVNLYFDRGDTWTYSAGSNYVIRILSTDPTVHVNAYGSGEKPIIDGQTADWTTAESTWALAVTAGDYFGDFWDPVFMVQKSNCTFQNLEIKRAYNAFSLGGDGVSVSGIEIKYCKIHDIGYTVIEVGADRTISDCVIEYNEIHEIVQFHRYEGGSGEPFYDNWPGAIQLAYGGSSLTYDHSNTYRYNLIYNIHGEGFNINAGTVEYNIIGSTWSVGIYISPKGHDVSHDSIVRYNLIVGNTDANYTHINQGARLWNETGIGYLDEKTSGSNTGMDLEIYGNTVIGCYAGIQIYDVFEYGTPDTIKIYNNTIIDNWYNFYAGNTANFSSVTVYNNAFVRYDTTGDHIYDEQSGEESGYWTIDNNAFWTTGGSPTVDADWQTNYVITNPRLYGEETTALNWDGLDSGDPRLDGVNVEFIDLLPESDSSLIDAGNKTLAGYDDDFLSTGSDFDDLPTTATFTLLDQDVRGTSWEIGAYVYDSDPVTGDPITITPPGALTIVPDAGGAITITY